MENLIVNKNTPRDVFMYLLSTITLIFWTISLGNMIFDLVNIYLPDPLSPVSVVGSKASIHWSIAMLIVVFPAYLWMMKFINNDVKQTPEKRELKIRKWLLYITIFLAGIIVAGNFIAIIYNFLRGELTMAFIIKIATMILISVMVFIYYRALLGSKEEEVIYAKGFPIGISILVASLIIFGFVAAGLPQSARAQRLDEIRVGNLTIIQSQINEYYRTHRNLPNRLDDIESIYVSIIDPSTKAPYEYQKLSDLKFELCAVFETSNKDIIDDGGVGSYNRPASPQEKKWLHNKGRICFEKTIDPANYPFMNTPNIKTVPSVQ